MLSGTRLLPVKHQKKTDQSTTVLPYYLFSIAGTRQFWQEIHIPWRRDDSSIWQTWRCHAAFLHNRKRDGPETIPPIYFCMELLQVETCSHRFNNDVDLAVDW